MQACIFAHYEVSSQPYTNQILPYNRGHYAGMSVVLIKISSRHFNWALDLALLEPWWMAQYKIVSYQHRDSHDKDKMVSWQSYLYNGNPIHEKKCLCIETGPWQLAQVEFDECLCFIMLIQFYHCDRWICHSSVITLTLLWHQNGHAGV